MSHRCLVAALTAIAVGLLVPLASAQPAESSAVPRTPWGTADLQGVWDFATLTPMERPEEFAGQAILTDEDAANVIEQAARRWQGISEGREGTTGTYDEFWFDAGSDVTADRRTSLIVDPADGRVPGLTPTAQKRTTARRAYLRDHPCRLLGRPQHRRALCFGVQHGTANDSECLQQRVSDVPNSRLRGDSQRDGERWTPELGQLAKVGSRPRRRSLECHGRDGVILLS